MHHGKDEKDVIAFWLVEFHNKSPNLDALKRDVVCIVALILRFNIHIINLYTLNIDLFSGLFRLLLVFVIFFLLLGNEPLRFIIIPVNVA